TMNAFVFISHSSKDFLQAQIISLTLEKSGIPTIMLPRDTVPGDNYVEQIGKMIHQAQAIIVLLSDNFITSLHCRNEIISAFENKKVIFPIQLQNRVDQLEEYRYLAHVLTGIHSVALHFDEEANLKANEAALSTLIARLQEIIKQPTLPVVEKSVPVKTEKTESTATHVCLACGSDLAILTGKDGKRKYYACSNRACNAKFNIYPDGKVGTRFDNLNKPSN
ncbi:MAG: toll/interleukin-1 receptor domain-containing protein, partial [Thiotrichales bacterium]|nr:toll/interleukin-1 receptor domain-containing protein [Thiotrichales bacterium]